MSSTRHPLLGIALCLIVAVSFACNTALASIAYRYGATPLSVLTYRTALAALAVFVVLMLSRVPMAMTPQRRWASIGVGVLLGAYSFGLLSAVAHMPLALAVLTFYVYPLFVGLASWALGRERMTWSLAGALVAAFIGLGFALDVGGGLNVIGTSFAMMGAVLITVTILLNAKVVGGQDSRPVSFYMLTTATAVYLLGDLVAGEFPVPTEPVAIMAFLGCGVFYAFSISGMFVAISWIGAVRATLILNLEPVTSVFLGTVVLQQAMKPTQFLGAALVVAAIVFTAWRRTAQATAKP